MFKQSLVFTWMLIKFVLFALFSCFCGYWFLEGLEKIGFLLTEGDIALVTQGVLLQSLMGSSLLLCTLIIICLSIPLFSEFIRDAWKEAGYKVNRFM